MGARGNIGYRVLENRHLLRQSINKINFNRSKKSKVILMITGLVASVLITGTVSLLIYTRDQGLLAEGIAISGLNVGNLTKNEAKTKLEERIQVMLAQQVEFNVDQKDVPLQLGQMGYHFDLDHALAKAYQVGRVGNLIAKATSKWKARHGMTVELTGQWDDQQLIDSLNNNLGNFNKAACDASFTITSDNKMEIKPEEVGKAVDVETLVSQIKRLEVNKPETLKVSFKDSQPQLTAAQLENEKVTGLLASYTTRFDPAEVGRTENVRIAAQALNGTVIKPGDVFSFNNVLGPRNEEQGYQEAYIVVNGEFVPGIGGGICQVSSTLYNTVLLAAMPIVERANHDLAISYVPLGQDATVAYPDLDLKFRNDSGGYLLIRSRVNTDHITIDLYGKANPDQAVLITDHTESVIPAGEQRVVDNSLPKGSTTVKQQGQPGYIVATYRQIKNKGQIIKNELLAESTYKALPTILAVNP